MAMRNAATLRTSVHLTMKGGKTFFIAYKWAPILIFISKSLHIPPNDNPHNFVNLQSTN